ncbi:hypothetical protein F5884DRAFT_791578 [Xylogone sp. PMI_703]|nr:hypothetical protein F5884DRAFT_791578 [Xylogone sp. PMI_703]
MSPRQSEEDTNREDEPTNTSSSLVPEDEKSLGGSTQGSHDGGEAERKASGSVETLQLQEAVQAIPTELTKEGKDSTMGRPEAPTMDEVSPSPEPSYPIDPMESSTATLKPEAPPTGEVSLPRLYTGSNTFVAQAPPTSTSSQELSRSPSRDAGIPNYALTTEAPRSPTRSDAGFDERQPVSEDEREVGSSSEIQSIMDQFSEEGQGPGHEEVMSPRLEIAGPLLGHPIQHPPRKSSLEPLSPTVAKSLQEFRLSSDDPGDSDIGPAVPPKPGAFSPTRPVEERYSSMDLPLSPSNASLHRPQPPAPEPEPDLPFDFHRFLEQLRHKTADPVAKFLRSFLQEFGKKQWMVHEQVKIISDFLAFITNKMAQCEVWREVSDAEFDNAREGMEKLVMNRLYTQTFSPAIPPPQPLPGSKPRKRGGERPMGPGRRGQHQEDVERDDVLAQKISIYSWVREEHLDIAPVGDSGRRFLVLAQQELLKLKTYRAPRDKIICVLNCCKVIFGLLKHSKSDSSADSFMPLLIYVVLQSNPDHLVSNVQYILRFRNQEKLGGEAGYYLSSLLGAIQFIENLDRTSLTISDEEFEKNVEAAVSAIAEKHQAEIELANSPTRISEKSGPSRPEVTSRQSIEAEISAPRKSMSSNEDENGSGSGSDEKAAMSGLLRSIQKPLSSIGRIFSEDGPSSQSGPARTPLPGNTPRLTPSPRVSTDRPQSPLRTAPQGNSARERMSAEDAAARQASAEAAEAHRLQRAEHANVVETLASMFPDLDREIISDVVVQKGGRVGLAVDACLALSS